MENLKDKIALVTGASRGVGKGIALGLIEAGAMVYITSRTVSDMDYLRDCGNAIECDHRDDAQTRSAFQRIADEQGRLDVLVTMYGAAMRKWSKMESTLSSDHFGNNHSGAGTRCFKLVCAHITSRVNLRHSGMVTQHRGLIVNISFWASQKYMSNVAYGVSKAATDKMTADMAYELREHNVAVVSLYPGLVRTEKVMQAAQWFDLSNSESPQFIGRAVAALAADEKIMGKTGQILVAANLAREYGFTDIDGKTPEPLTVSKS